MIDLYDGLIFLVAVGVGAWVQALSGFAFGLIVIAVVQLTGSISVIEAAAAISILAFANIALSLRDSYQAIDKRLFAWLIAGQIPAIGLGIWLLNYLSQSSISTLELIFGLFLIASGLSLTINTKVKPERSKDVWTLIAGFFGGIFGGMFAASGPVTGWYAYRQPLVISAIRASLLAMLGVTTVTRTVLVTIDGVFHPELLIWILAGIPVVILFTYSTKYFTLQVSDIQFRRAMFILVLIAGCWMVGQAVGSMFEIT